MKAVHKENKKSRQILWEKQRKLLVAHTKVVHLTEVKHTHNRTEVVCRKASAVGRSWSWSHASRSSGAKEGMLTACANDAHATRPANSHGDPLNGYI